MKSLVTYAAGSQVASATLNQWQLQGAGILPADAGNDFAPSGLDGRLWQYATTIASSAAPVTIDATIDWRDRMVMAWYLALGTASIRPGGATDYTTVTGMSMHSWYTGQGGRQTSGAAVSAGNAPVQGAAGAFTSYGVQIGQQTLPGGAPTIAGLWLYADPTDSGKLKIYNATGFTITAPMLWLFASGDCGKY